MGCKQICSVDPGIHKCCLECEKYKECNILCDDLDQYEYMEECPDYVKEDSMDNTYVPTEEKTQKKIKVDSIDTIVTMHGDKPYYENKYREVGDKYYHIGYSSYYLDVALEDRKKYFEVVERESDWIPCNERMPKGTVLCCDDRGNMLVGLLCKDEAGYMAYGDDGQEMYNCVAWMPLPEPYREEE